MPASARSVPVPQIVHIKAVAPMFGADWRLLQDLAWSAGALRHGLGIVLLVASGPSDRGEGTDLEA